MVIKQIDGWKRVTDMLFPVECLPHNLHVHEAGSKYFGNLEEGTFVAWREIRETFMKEVT